MHFTPILGLAFLAVGHVISHPAANPAGGIVARDDECGNDDSGILKRAKCKKPVTCGPTGEQTTYTAGKVNSVVRDVKQRLSKDEKNGNYPKAYGVNDISVGKALPDDCRPVGDFKYWEYPILSSGPYDGLDPGTDRVLIAEKNGARTYCLTMTHKGATDNSFVPCVEYTA